MKFEANPLVLVEELSLACLLSSNKSPDPLGGAIRLKLIGNKLWVSIVRKDSSLRYSIEVEGEEDGEVGVDLDMLLADLSSMRSIVKAHSTNKNLMLSSGRSHRRRPIIPIKQFQSEVNISGTKVVMDSVDLVDAITCTKYAVIKDMSRPELKCVRFSSGVVMGSNGQMFSVVEMPSQIDMSIPDIHADALVRILSSSETVEVIKASWVQFSTEKAVLKISLINSDYPDAAVTVFSTYKAKKPKVTMIANKPALYAIFNSLCTYIARGKTYGIEYVTLDFGEGYPRLVTDIPDTGRFEDEIPVEECKGSLPQFLFSPELFITTLDKISGDKVEINLFSVKEPMLIRDPEKDNWAVIQSAMGARSTIQEDDF
jgi:DNA polymerase III sliding clamp (beta) subunit (PCNA family)